MGTTDITELIVSSGATMDSDYNANTILAATSDNTPVALEVAASRVVGRTSSGNIAALTGAEVNTLIGRGPTTVFTCYCNDSPLKPASTDATSSYWLLDETDDYVQIQAAIDAAELVKGKVVVVGRTVKLGATGVTLDTDDTILDMSTCSVEYGGTGAAITVSANYRAQLYVDEIVATGSAKSSATATGLDWAGYHGICCVLKIRDFNAGIGRHIGANVNRAFFGPNNVWNCLIGTEFEGDCNWNQFGDQGYRQEASGGVSGGTAFSVPASATLYGCVFNSLGADLAGERACTVLDIADFNFPMTVGSIGYESDYPGASGGTLLLHAHQTSGLEKGVIFTDKLVMSNTGSAGYGYCQGDAVNIQTRQMAGNMMTANPASASDWTSYNSNAFTLDGLGMNMPRALKMHYHTTDNDPIAFPNTYSGLVPGSLYSVASAVRATKAGTRLNWSIFPKNIYGQSLQQATSPWFVCEAANTYYYFCFPVDYVLDNATSYGRMMITVNNDTLDDQDDIYFSQIGMFGPDSGYTAAAIHGPPNVPASTVDYTNAYGHACDVWITGGTVTQVLVNGGATGQTSGHFYVPDTQTINITYSSAPTWAWYER